MKITSFLFFCAIFTLFAENTHSQNAKVTIHRENVALQEVLNDIEEQTEYLFLYNKKNVDVNHPTTVRASNQPVSKVLDRVLEGTNVNYEMVGNHIVLSDQVKNAPEGTQQNSRTITGIVKDETGEPIIGANIVEKGTTNGVVTDYNGNFTLSVSPSATIQISYIGYISQDIRVENQTSLNIILREDSQSLNEVVVIGYGTQKKADLTGSVANINAEKLNTQSNANLGLALQGKIAGVDIVTQGGSPGSGAKVMIRGIGTLNNSNPLYIVDGMYMDNIDHINTNDIASIDVLKDASSAAIYGSRAANGVVILTTKEGANTEGKPIVDISVNMGVQMPNKYLDMLNAAEWAKVTTVAREAINMPALDMAIDLANKPDNDWQRITLSPALMQNYNASLKGGGNTYNYYAGVGYMNQDGVVDGTNYERFSFQFKSNYKKGIFSAGNNIVMTSSHDAPHPSESRGGMLGSILQAVPTLEKYDENNVGGYGGSYGDVVNLNHPLGVMDKNLAERYNENQKVYINLYLQLEPIEGLKYKLNITPDFQFGRSMYYLGLYDWGLRSNEDTSIEESRVRKNNILIENLLTFDRTFGDHKVSALAGYSYQDNRYRYLEAKGKGMPLGLKEVDAATIERVNGGNSRRSVLTSVLARVFYSYKNRYLITATIRRDGSSKFAEENRYGNFPSASIGWNISEENFMKSLHWMDQLKVRAGYGVLGNQEIDDYQYTSTISTGINYPDGKGGLLQGAFPKEFANPAIKWEETTMTNLGLDFVALNNRLSLTADYFIKNTKDILLSVPIPISSGGANDPVRNAGEIQNNGFEFNLGWNDRPNADISYGMNLIGSFIKNEVTKMGSGSQVIWGGSTVQNINTSKTLAGYPIAGFWLIPYDGIFRSEAEVAAHSKDGVAIQPNATAGDVRFKDTNNDGQINDDDRVYCGSPFPDVTFSLNGNISYKNIDASIGFQAVIGNKIYNATRQTLEDVSKGTNYLRTTLDYWTPENPNASFPRLVWDDPNRNARAESDRYLESGSYFRIRNIQLGYTFSNTLFKDMIDKARIYFNVENPLTLTSYKGYSPDVNASGTYSRGLDYFIYPTNRVFMLGLNVTF
ncbi:TonB-dependent receptor [Parabacteroides sp. PF5-6]|uniref:TonB-dependent receptor n=1 Tax=Parabacteroides sp. PF5-6 TaxID=1742403 RepID=UPI002406D902|nr:TonB-dependent receptor [Parabacteroides sp. PF5-6]